MTEPILVPAVKRARLDPVGKLVAMADQAGVRFRWEGRTLRIAGAGALHLADQQLLREHIEEIKARLSAQEDAADPCEQWGIEVRLVTSADEARTIVAGLPDRVGLDIETSPRSGFVAADRPWIKITRKGAPYKEQPKSNDRIGLDPFRAEPRLVQVFDPEARVVHVIDLRRVPLEALVGLWRRRLIAHNASFELAQLARIGVHPTDMVDSMQLAGLCFGCAPGARRIENVVKEVLDTEMPKVQQVSDWGADQLSLEQIRYAAADAAAAYLVAKEISSQLPPPERRVFRLQNSVVPIAATMELAGVGFDVDVHRGRITEWETALAEARRQFVQLIGGDIPKMGAQRREWLEQRLSPEQLTTWPRTDAGYLSTKADDLARLVYLPEIEALLRVDVEDKKLRDFGRKLIGLVNPVTGRIHPSWMPCGAKTGRFTCSGPNLQQVPKKERRAFVAQPGRLLVIADYSQIEFRVAAELAQETDMRTLFANGIDLHRRNAVIFARCFEDQVTQAMRSKAKATGFGELFGQGPGGLVQTAWNDWRVVLSLEEAEELQRAFSQQYPRLREWQRENYNRRGRREGCVRTIRGRPLYAGWESSGRIRWTQACNFPVQGSAADLMLDALIRVAKAIAGHDARLIMQVHDELVLECAEDIVPDIEALVVEHMTAAWVELFPEAPSRGIVESRTSPVWAKEE